jgi:hypothetical protein
MPQSAALMRDASDLREDHRMRRYLYAMALSLLAVLGAAPAHACRMVATLDVGDIRYASVVVLGRISHYEIVLDQAARQRRQDLLARSPDMSPALRKLLSDQKAFSSDYARFDVHVDEILAGRASKTLSVTWNNSTFGEPDKMPEGPFLIALLPGAAGLGSDKAKSLTVLQSPCALPFILEKASAEANAVRAILRTTPK